MDDRKFQENSTIVSRKVKFLVSARNSKFSVSVNEAYTVNNLNISVSEADQEGLQTCWKHISNLELTASVPGEVTVPLGMNFRPALDIVAHYLITIKLSHRSS